MKREGWSEGTIYPFLLSSFSTSLCVPHHAFEGFGFCGSVFARLEVCGTGSTGAKGGCALFAWMGMGTCNFPSCGFLA